MEKKFLTPLVQGVAPDERIGRRINITKISCKGFLKLKNQVLTSNTAEVVRLLLIQDNQTNGSIFPTNALLVSDTWTSFNDLSTKGRFKVLKVMEYNLVARCGSGEVISMSFFGEDIAAFSFTFVPKRPIVCEFSGSTGAITELRTKSVYFCTQSADGGLVDIVGEARTRYTD